MSSRPPAVLALDVGSTSTKAGLVGLHGAILGSARSTYPLRTAQVAGRAEQDPEAWWGAVVEVGHGLVQKRVAEVVAIAVDGHGPTLTAVDADGRPTRPAITWLDTRSRPELDELTEVTGLRGWALGVLPAALHVERHEPGVAASTRWYLNTWEFAALRLSGVAATTLVPGQPSPASPEALDRGIDASRIPAPIAAGAVLGRVTAEAAAQTGLQAGIPVVAVL